ncbi:hypothetical protein DFS34DRAFT_688802 [Phlyctochytrium arcticum]|nr:hypothetical protein DFS34DRAFT_688802 [Phlyctochytrium arcticum]
MATPATIKVWYQLVTASGGKFDEGTVDYYVYLLDTNTDIDDLRHAGFDPRNLRVYSRKDELDGPNQTMTELRLGTKVNTLLTDEDHPLLIAVPAVPEPRPNATEIMDIETLTKIIDRRILQLLKENDLINNNVSVLSKGLNSMMLITKKRRLATLLRQFLPKLFSTFQRRPRSDFGTNAIHNSNHFAKFSNSNLLYRQRDAFGLMRINSVMVKMMVLNLNYRTTLQIFRN